MIKLRIFDQHFKRLIIQQKIMKDKFTNPYERDGPAHYHVRGTLIDPVVVSFLPSFPDFVQVSQRTLAS